MKGVQMEKILQFFCAKKGQSLAATEVRSKCGAFSSIVGILANVFLFAVKYLSGMIIGSIAVSADAFNNLSDAASSVISLVTFRIASKPADREHPFGHARMEYVSSMIVSFLIILVGYELAKGSIQKIVTPQQTAFNPWVAVALGLAIVVKVFLYLMNRRIGKIIDSEVLRATAMDSISDAVATSAVLVSSLLLRFMGWDIDAYMGLLVALFIMFTGGKLLWENKNMILGEAPSKETVEEIKAIIGRFPEAVGIHDLTLHSYGPGKMMVSFHAEVDGREDIFKSHDAIDNMERTVKEELGIDCIIHMDPIVVGDETVDRLRGQVEQIAQAIDSRIHIHDFRCVIGDTHTNLIFDMEVPFEVEMDNKTLMLTMSEAVQKEMGRHCFAVTTVDRC